MTFSSAEEKKIIEQNQKYGYSNNKRNTLSTQPTGKLYNSLYRMGQNFTLMQNSKANSQKKVMRTQIHRIHKNKAHVPGPESSWAADSWICIRKA